MDRRSENAVAKAPRREKHGKAPRREKRGTPADTVSSADTRTPRREGSEASADGMLITGATGFLGMELLARHLERSDRQIYALVRAASPSDAQARIRRTLLRLFGPRHPHDGRVTPVRGDLTRPRLGLSRRRREELAGRVSEIAHCGASVSFEATLQDSRAINVEGTRRVLELAERCEARGGLRRLTHVSTAYVAGDHAGCFSEDDLHVGQRFRNAYERSKHEAEDLVTRSRAKLPITIVRPSIVVGEQGSGWTASFNVLYWPLRVFSRGAYPALPARSGAPVDIVPVDYVADAIFALSAAPQALGGTFHITAGRNATNVGEVVELASAFFHRSPPRMIEPRLYRTLVHPLLMRASRDERYQRALRRSEVFFPYFTASVRYDDRRARAILHRTGIEPPPLPAYFDRLVEFALAADWGRRPLPRSGVVVPIGVRRVQRPRKTQRPLALTG
jgi:thioester reductase-like protein